MARGPRARAMPPRAREAGCCPRYGGAAAVTCRREKRAPLGQEFHNLAKERSLLRVIASDREVKAAVWALKRGSCFPSTLVKVSRREQERQTAAAAPSAAAARQSGRVPVSFGASKTRGSCGKELGCEIPSCEITSGRPALTCPCEQGDAAGLRHPALRCSLPREARRLRCWRPGVGGGANGGTRAVRDAERRRLPAPGAALPGFVAALRGCRSAGKCCSCAGRRLAALSARGVLVPEAGSRCHRAGLPRGPTARHGAVPGGSCPPCSGAPHAGRAAFCPSGAVQLTRFCQLA